MDEFISEVVGTDSQAHAFLIMTMALSATDVENVVIPQVIVFLLSVVLTPTIDKRKMIVPEENNLTERLDLRLAVEAVVLDTTTQQVIALN